MAAKIVADAVEEDNSEASRYDCRFLESHYPCLSQCQEAGENELIVFHNVKMQARTSYKIMTF